MGVATSTLIAGALIASAAASLGGTGYAIASGEQAKSEAKKKERGQRRELAEAEQRAADRARADEEAAKSNVRRARTTIRTGGDRSGTIATSPAGVIGSSGGAAKTLLGT